MVASTKIILVYGSLRVGGIETLIVRFSNYVSQLDFDVFVCCNSGGQLEASLRDEVKLISYSTTEDLKGKLITAANSDSNLKDIIFFSFDPISAARAITLECSFSKKIRTNHISGVFHPSAYFMTGERYDRIILNRIVARAVGKSNLFFMNKECRDSHACRWKINLDAAPIIPLPVNDAESRWKNKGGRAVKIVSVGRLVDFKAYNLGIPSVISNCIERGMEVSWDVYGDGPLKSQLEYSVSQAGLSKFVRFLGALPYENFQAKILEYDLFVGMGTSALEAAMVGVPTICAIIDEPFDCYGYIFELPFGNVGEKIPGQEFRKISDLIFEYYIYDEKRVELSRSCYLSARKYSMSEFFDSVYGVWAYKKSNTSLFSRALVGKVYHIILEGVIFSVLRKIYS